MDDQSAGRGSGMPGAGARGAIGAALGAVAAGALSLLSDDLSGTATALLTIAGTLLGWGLEALFEKEKRGAATVVVLISSIGVVAILYAWVWRDIDTTQNASGPPTGTADAHQLPSSTAPPTAESVPSTATAPAGIDDDGRPTPIADASSSVTFEWITDAVRVSRAAPTILAFPRGHVGNGQQVDISFDNLSMGAIEFDVFDPGGSTFMGWSRGSPSYAFSVSYIFNPPTSGSYRLRIRDKETGGSAETTVYLYASSDGPYVVEASGSSQGTVSALVAGKGCDVDGAAVIIEYTGAGQGDTFVLKMPDGQEINGGVSADSVGHGTGGLVLRSNRCTGTAVPGFRVALLSTDGTTRATYDFAVPN